jgi:hypothetical protein
MVTSLENENGDIIVIIEKWCHAWKYCDVIGLWINGKSLEKW